MRIIIDRQRIMAVLLRNLLPAMIVVGILPGLRCSGVNNLPEFRDIAFAGDPNHEDMFQAIIPAYSFQCSGRVTEWRACVLPGGSSDNDRYYIQFQVWRPSSSTSGCYSLVGFNSPLNSDGTDGVLRAQLDGVGRCVELSVSEDQQIDVQEGDVIGYYVDSFRNNNGGGIQWDTQSSNVVIYYMDGVPREQRRSIYAISASATDCGAPSDGSNSYSLSFSTSAAPIISLTVVQLPSSTRDGVVTTYVQPLSTTTPSGDATTTELSPPGSTSSPLPKLSLSLSTSSIITPSPSPPLTQQEPETVDGGVGGGGGSQDVVLVVAIVAVALFVLAILAVLTIILTILRRKRISRKLQLSENVAYSVHDHEDKKSPTANQKEEEDSVKFVNTTNPAYATTTQSISTSTNEVYYDPISVGTTENVAYATSTENTVGGGENEQISTNENVSYATNEGFSATENPAYGVGGSSSIPTDDNPSYGPVEGGADADLQYDYVAQ